ncbi:MAG: hypothetical protein JRN15_18625, partial [Nitrososphaerota archaeon]|nr:hypothetical protein [Nitrososphaerota archaeon]
MTAETSISNTPIANNKESIFGVGSLVTLFVPIAALLVALASGSFLLLDYVHVLSGATWTGIDLFMGLVMSRVLRSLAPPAL